MKRVGYLIEQIADIDNLRLAFYKAARSKEAKEEVNLYRLCLDTNLFYLRNSLLNSEVIVGDYHYFKIFDPKERLICAAAFSERVLHHAIMNICHTLFEKFQIFDSYATRKDKGQYAALERATMFHKKNKWFCKLDVRKYFDSINHEVLMEMLCKMFKDKALIAIFDKILKTYNTRTGCGLPIGNLTSQYFANFYLAYADHYIKEKLQIKAYVRYMDDMVIWHTSKEDLLQIRSKFICFVQDKLKLEIKPDCLNSIDKGLPFLGYVVFPTYTRLSKRSKIRFINKIKVYNNLLNENEWSQAEYSKHILPLVSFTEHADTRNFRNIILKKMETC